MLFGSHSSVMAILRRSVFIHGAVSYPCLVGDVRFHVQFFQYVVGPVRVSRPGHGTFLQVHIAENDGPGRAGLCRMALYRFLQEVARALLRLFVYDFTGGF